MRNHKKTKKRIVSFCCSSVTKPVKSPIFQDKPGKREKPVLKSLKDLRIERAAANPVKIWINKLGEMCFCSMNTTNGLKI